MRRYFGTDGIRGEVGKGPITPDFILKLGWAAGRVLSPGGGGLVVIGKDTRISGYMFESALQAGLSAAGVDVRLLGPLPTPGVAYLTRTLRARAGIVISASHNAFSDNGIKFFSADGYKFSDEVELAIEAELEKTIDTVSSEHLGKAERVEDARGRYIEYCKSVVPNSLSLEGMKIVVDCANGATYHTGPEVFTELGAEVITIAAQPDGLNINHDCGSTHPGNLKTRVIESGADLGIAFDGDGDRVLMVDHQGDLVDGDELLFVIANSRLQAGDVVTGVVGTKMTNLGLEHAFAEKGVKLFRADVGDRYVMEVLKAEGLTLGGESSGHVIDLAHSTTGDGIVSALQVLCAMQRSGNSLHALKSGMSKYPQCMINVPIAEKANPDQHAGIQQSVAEANADLADEGRVLLRASGTEPLIRVMVEGRDAAKVEKTAEQLAAVVREALC